MTSVNNVKEVLSSVSVSDKYREVEREEYNKYPNDKKFQIQVDNMIGSYYVHKDSLIIPKLSNKIVGNPKALDEHVVKVKDIKQSIRELKAGLFREAIDREVHISDPKLDRLPLTNISDIIDEVFGKELSQSTGNTRK